MMDDWDAVSSPVEPQDTDATDPWDAVSTLKPQRQKQGQTTPEPEPPDLERRQSPPPGNLMTAGQDAIATPPKPTIRGASGFSLQNRGLSPASLVRGIQIFIGVALLLLLIGSGLFRVINTNKANSFAAATAQARSTIVTQGNATATTVAITLEQMYLQDTSGTPLIDDPLRDNSMGYAWGVLTLSFGGTCFFTGTDYHISIPNSGYYWMWCAGRNIYLNNFAFQVQENMIKPGDAGIVFGYTTNGFYRMDVGSAGTFTLYQYTQNNQQTRTLESGSNPAIKSGLNQANVITLIVNNGILYFYVNNQFVTTANLSVSGLTYTTGTFGFAAANFGQPTEVVYTNLKIWSVP